MRSARSSGSSHSESSRSATGERPAAFHVPASTLCAPPATAGSRRDLLTKPTSAVREAWQR